MSILEIVRDCVEFWAVIRELNCDFMFIQPALEKLFRKQVWNAKFKSDELFEDLSRISFKFWLIICCNEV